MLRLISKINSVDPSTPSWGELVRLSPEYDQCMGVLSRLPEVYLKGLFTQFQRAAIMSKIIEIGLFEAISDSTLKIRLKLVR